MGSKRIIWCAHPNLHRECTKIGSRPTYPKGKRVVKKKLADFILNQYRRPIGRMKTVIKESDLLCTGFLNFENNNENKI